MLRALHMARISSQLEHLMEQYSATIRKRCFFLPLPLQFFHFSLKLPELRCGAAHSRYMHFGLTKRECKIFISLTTR